jgi:transmembrane sensor
MNPETIAAFLAKNLTKDEEQVFFAWLDESDENRRLFAEMKNTWSLAAMYGDVDNKKVRKQKFELLKQKLDLTDEKSRRFQIGYWLQDFRKIAAILVLVVGLTSVFSYFIWSPAPKKMAWHQLIVPGGQQAQLTLEDGTKIWLNSKSKLTYPAGFAGDTREVKLDGEAYFEVTHNEDIPFIVNTSKINVKVLGTSFNVSAYKDDKELKFTLVSGSVSLFEKETGSELARLKPNDLAVYSKVKQSLKLETVEPEIYTSWKQGQFRFRKMSFEEIAVRLSRNYNVEFRFKDEALKKTTFTGSFYEYESLEQVLKIMQTNSPFRYSFDKNLVTIESNNVLTK